MSFEKKYGKNKMIVVGQDEDTINEKTINERIEFFNYNNFLSNKEDLLIAIFIEKVMDCLQDHRDISQVCKIIFSGTDGLWLKVEIERCSTKEQIPPSY